MSQRIPEEELENAISFAEAQERYWKEKYGFVNLKEEIKERIGEYPNYKISFDMSKTHSQDNSTIDKHNKKVFEKFSDLINTERVWNWFDCWKGMCFFSLNKNFNSSIKEFGGWTTNEILYWILTEGRYFIFEDEMKKKNEEYNRMYKEILKDNNISRIITKEQRFEVLRRQKWRCNQCNERLKFNKYSEWEGEIAHIDHIHPYSKRDTYTNGKENINETSNLQALCPKCNLTKNDKKIH